MLLDLFSGIGGFSLAAHWAEIKTVAFCESDPFCEKVLKKNFPSIPVFPDICKLKRGDIDGTVDVITGGFPCQPFSIAGRKKGTQDNRDLWPEMFRVVKEFKPTWVIGENVANFVNMAFQRTKIDLESEGYEVQPFIIPACGVGAPHRRDRVWIVAYSQNNSSERKLRDLHQANESIFKPKKQKQKKTEQLRNAGKYAQRSRDVVDSKRNEHNREIGGGFEEEGENEEQERKENSTARKSSGTSEVRLSDNRHEGSEDVANFESIISDGRENIDDKKSRKGQGEFRGKSCHEEPNRNWWESEPNVGRVANGIPNRVDRLKSLGNSIVPQVAYQIFKGIVMPRSAK